MPAAGAAPGAAVVPPGVAGAGVRGGRRRSTRRGRGRNRRRAGAGTEARAVRSSRSSPVQRSWSQAQSSPALRRSRQARCSRPAQRLQFGRHGPRANGAGSNAEEQSFFVMRPSLHGFALQRSSAVMCGFALDATPTNCANSRLYHDELGTDSVRTTGPSLLESGKQAIRPRTPAWPCCVESGAPKCPCRESSKLRGPCPGRNLLAQSRSEPSGTLIGGPNSPTSRNAQGRPPIAKCRLAKSGRAPLQQGRERYTSWRRG